MTAHIQSLTTSPGGSGLITAVSAREVRKQASIMNDRVFQHEMAMTTADIEVDVPLPVAVGTS
jgi:hypothetical protein